MTGQTIESLHPDLGTFVDWVWALKQERDELRARLEKPVADFNPEHTLFNEIRTSTPVNDECGALQYLVNEQQLQRIRELEVPDAQHGRDSAELRKLCQSRDDARRERDLLKAELDTRVRQVERLLGEYQEALSDIRALRKKLDSAKSAPVVDRAPVRDAVAAALGDAYDCTRVWAAWGVGTMSEDDFQLVAEDDERLDEIVEAALVAAGLAVPS